jgi:hypothetical protein
VLHIVHGGIENGDKAGLEKAAKQRLAFGYWVVPKRAQVGDVVVIFVMGIGFFATARVTSIPEPDDDWKNRYTAGIDSVRLIDPPISIGSIQAEVPQLKWANYPRSITTPSPKVGTRIAALIKHRRKVGLPRLDEKSLAVASLEELRRVAILGSKTKVPGKTSQALTRSRSTAIKRYVLARADGVCEGCRLPAPFVRLDGSHYLEPHHTTRLSDDGPDHPAKVIALCPNCHRRAHYAVDGKAFNEQLIKRVRRIEK